jgi:hypothetical protein
MLDNLRRCCSIAHFVVAKIAIDINTGAVG